MVLSTSENPVTWSAMRYRNPRVYMGGLLRPPEYSRTVTDPKRIQELVSQAGGNDA